jgi:hypothetical protein
MRCDDDLKETIRASQELMIKTTALFNNEDADTVVYVMSWLMGIYVHSLVDRELMSKEQALQSIRELIDSAYIAQGENDDD